ncbi:MAG: gfo/Idh/MocA family oxidoreductase [Paucibacter sp.]|nr:gfo/Idh/MocA family oxidoreductase [Roseateles sp.]
MQSLNVWLIGAGGMAVDYAKVLLALGANITVIGRGEESARQMIEKCEIAVVTGGLEQFLAGNPPLPDAAIVAVGVEGLATAANQLLVFGVRKILLEKPGALRLSELTDLNELSKSCKADVSIAYNRRMYIAVSAARKIIEQDGGILSMHFEFTEWGHVIEGIVKAPGVKEAWLLGNSTHVIDLAFNLGGYPVHLQTQTSGSLSWHPSSAIFAGSGRTDKDVLFSYQANWDAPGRWGLEVLTRHRRLIFRPMETLQVMHRGSIAIEPVDLDYALEKQFKPGLYKQVAEFLQSQVSKDLCKLEEQVAMWPIYMKMAGYSNG